MAALPQQGAAPLAPLRGYPCTPTKTVHPPLASVPFLRVLLSYPGGDTHSHLLAGEPTGNLDSKTSSDVIGLLKRTSAEFHQTIVMITHNDDIARLADRIIRIEDGKITGGMEL